MRLAGLVMIAACAEATAPDPGDAVPVALSPAGAHVFEALRANHREARGLTWDLSTDNVLAAGWIVQTPLASTWGQPAAALSIARPCAGDPACDPDFGLLACASQADCRDGGTCRPVRATVARAGDPPRSLCVGHSDAVVDQIYDVIASAQHTVEITSLVPPDGRFEAAIRNAITFLARSGRAVRVRVLWGAIPGEAYDPSYPSSDQLLASLVRDVDPGAPVRVAAGDLRASIESWPHAKIIAADGATAIVGGHNLLTRHYLQAAPAFDLSMQLTGTAAAQASHFADALWRHACKPPGTLDATASVSGFPDRSAGCDPTPDVVPASGTGGVPLLLAGRLGALGDDASDDALVALVDSATTRLRVSQQDVGPLGAGAPWPEPLLRALVAAAARGVDIELVITNLDARPDGLDALSASYSNGWTPHDVVEHVLAFDPEHVTCGRLHVASLRPGPDDAWPDGSPFANHAKLAIADDSTFYIGSQNWYPADLAEVGYVVDDQTAARELADAYFTPAWQQSRRTEAPCP